MLKKILLLLFLSIGFSGCSPLPKDWHWGIRPRPFSGYAGFPSAETIYGQGFKEGCMAGWKTTSKGLLGDVNVKFDAQMMQNNKDYSVGWSDGYNHCVDVMDWELP